jgi:hypothetical protein
VDDSTAVASELFLALFSAAHSNGPQIVRQSITPPTRRWFQFGLGTMFVVVTAVAVWLAWELSYIRERQAFLASLQHKNAEVTDNRTTWTFTHPPRAVPPEIPLWRRWLGDRAVDAIDLPPKWSASDRQMAKALFPEAIIRPKN